MKAVSARQGPQPTLLAAAQLLLELKEVGRVRLSMSAGRWSCGVFVWLVSGPPGPPV